MTTLEAELAAAGSKRWWNRWTMYLLGALLIVGGFIGGIEAQKAYGDPATAAGGPGGGATGGMRGAGGYGGFPGGASNGGGGFNGGGTTGGNAAAAAPTTGTVKLVDGTTVYVQTESGEVITVRTDGETTVAVPSALKDIKAGDKVSVEGETDTSGTMTATTVTETK